VANSIEVPPRGEPSSLPLFVILVGNSKKTQRIGVPESILGRVFEPIRELGKSKGQDWGSSPFTLLPELIEIPRGNRHALKPYIEE
jgi:hypothetical protein